MQPEHPQPEACESREHLFESRFPMVPTSDIAKTKMKTVKTPATKRGPPTFANARKENYKNTEQNSECSSSLAGAALTVTNYVIHARL